MDATTELLKDYLFDKGIQLKNLSEKANIPYSTLRDVFCNKKSKRSLEAGIHENMSFFGIKPYEIL